MKEPWKPIISTCFGEPFWNSLTQAWEAEDKLQMESFSCSASFEKMTGKIKDEVKIIVNQTTVSFSQF